MSVCMSVSESVRLPVVWNLRIAYGMVWESVGEDEAHTLCSVWCIVCGTWNVGCD